MPVTNVKSEWESGNLVFRSSDGTEIAQFDGVNDLLQVPYAVRTIRSRFTIAQVNAGATILAALPGYKYRMVDALAISVGGAAATVTTVDILGTQTTAAKLVAFAQASLTENTVLRAGGTGADVLAAGASFIANDANTAITIGKTGSNVATATHIDVVLSYVIEAA